MTETAPAVLSGASVFYGEVIGLSRVDLTLRPGITGVVGPNGSGKSTLMRVLTGLHKPGEGSVLVFGQAPFGSPDVRRRIGFVPATECFFDALSGRRNLEVMFLAQGQDRPSARALAERALQIGGMSEHGHRRYGTWSRGMRQRLKLGLVLAGDPEMVLLDEPFLGVDPPTRKLLSAKILDLGRIGRTVLVSSHVLHEVESLTDRVGILARGRLLGFGQIAQLLLELRDRHPHRIRVATDRPRELASALTRLPHVRETKIVSRDVLEFITERPQVAYRELPGVVVETEAVVRQVQTLDDGLEAVFRHMTAAGTRRL